jgi:hypothetical protein
VCDEIFLCGGSRGLRHTENVAIGGIDWMSYS